MTRPVVCIVRSRSLPLSKRADMPLLESCQETVEILTSLECERCALALNSLAATAPLTQDVLDEIGNAICHDLLRMKSSEFERGKVHAEWLHQVEKEKFLAQAS